MSLVYVNAKEAEDLVRKATDLHQYDVANFNWKQEGMLDSPTRQFLREYLEKYLENLTNKSVIDIGSGTGHLTKLFIQAGAKEIYGIEPSLKNVEISRELYPEMIVEEIGLEGVKIKNLFDVAVLVMVFEHIRDLDTAFQKIAQMVRPVGTFYVIVGDKEYGMADRFGYTIEVGDLGKEEVVVATKRPYGVMHDIYRPLSCFINAAEKNGFSIMKSVPLLPTEKFIQMEPKYKSFATWPICHLLIFSRNK